MELIIRDNVSAKSILARVATLVYQGLDAGAVVLTIGRLSKSREQEAKYHCLITDIAKTVKLDKQYSIEAWKALLVDGYEQELRSMGESLRHPGKVIPSLDGQRVVTVRPTTTKFLKKEASGFIQYLYAFGIEHGAVFSERAIEYVQEV